MEDYFIKKKYLEEYRVLPCVVAVVVVTDIVETVVDVVSGGEVLCALMIYMT